MDRIARERRNNQNKDGFLICQTASQLKRGKRGNQPEPMPRSVGQAKAEKLRQIKASVASASQGIYNEETPSATAAEAHRYVHRRSSAPPPPVPPRNRNSRPQEPEYYGGSDVASSGKGGKIAGIIVLVLVVLLLIGYLIGYFSYRSKLLQKPMSMVSMSAE